ncbi:MAG: DMT family transporter [Spirochaetes bacterium]|nr:DMT family transporter [Spirochaetota bacterium]
MTIRFAPFLLAGISAALFGLATPASKLLLHGINPFLLAGLLYLGASAGLLPAVLAKRELPRAMALRGANRARLLGAVALGGIAAPILLLFGLQYAPASSVSLWLNLELVATALLGALFFRDHLGRRGWAGVLIALASGVMLTLDGGSTGAVAALLIALACLCWGLDNHFTALIDGISAVQSTFWKGLISGTVNTAVGLLLSRQPAPARYALYAVLLGSLSYGVSIVLYIMSAQRLGAIRSQIVFSSAPFFGVVFSVLLLAERMTLLQTASFFLLAGAILLMASERHEHRHEHQETTHRHYHGHDDLHHGHRHDVPAGYHEHTHAHERGEHSHPHWPDLHHRHGHE